MAIAAAVAAGLGSALAYGIGTAGQHRAAYCGEVDAKGLASLTRDRRWLLASCGDVAGMVLQLVALANGPVLLVQPLLVFSLPVAVLAGPWFGLARPHRQALINCLVLAGGLTLFLLLIGQPERGSELAARAAGWTVALALVTGAAVLLAARGRPPRLRAVAFGAVAGCWFGVVSVLVEALARTVQRGGVATVAHPAGMTLLVGVLVLASAAFVLVQSGFQVGPLEASVPANLVLDPLIAVVLGASLLHEHLPVGGLRLAGYGLALLLVAGAAVALARHPAARSQELVTAS